MAFSLKSPRIALVMILLIPFSTSIVRAQEASLYTGLGEVSFISDAPLETITATTSELYGVLDLSKSTFAFSFQVASFKGFNSPLQQEHFNEHYLETRRYPKASFTGKMVGFRPCQERCELEITARGKMTIHGITKVISIPVTIRFDPKATTLSAEANFDASLEDYGINIPIIVAAKISPVIQINVAFTAQPKGNE